VAETSDSETQSTFEVLQLISCRQTADMSLLNRAHVPSSLIGHGKNCHLFRSGWNQTL